MTQRNNILQELSELNSSLSNVAVQNVYTVPAGYFDALPVQILARIKAMEALNTDEELDHLSPVINNISKQIPYTVPAGYFDSLPENMMQLIRESSDYQTAQEELESISPLLSGLKKQMPYSVPEGYFDDISEVTIPETNKPASKVVSITHRKWFRYAAAAVVTGMIVTAGFLVFGNKETTSSGSTIAAFDAKLTKEIKKMSDQELSDFIQYTDAGLTGDEKVSNNTTDEVKDMLKDVPDAELKTFLEETSDADADPTMMN